MGHPQRSLVRWKMDSVKSLEQVVSVASVLSSSPVSPLPQTALGSSMANKIWREVSGWIAEKCLPQATEVLVLAAPETVTAPRTAAASVVRWGIRVRVATFLQVPTLSFYVPLKWGGDTCCRVLTRE